MPTKPCPCGKPVRLGAMRVTVMRKRGVAHYIEHRDGSRCEHTKSWTCAMFKPYPKVESEKPWRQMLDRWEAQCDATNEGIEYDLHNDR